MFFMYLPILPIMTLEGGPYLYTRIGVSDFLCLVCFSCIYGVHVSDFLCFSWLLGPPYAGKKSFWDI
jgi:hypothetical protein